MIENAGFHTHFISNSIVSKQITAIIKKTPCSSFLNLPEGHSLNLIEIINQLFITKSKIKTIVNSNLNRSIGIYGTATSSCFTAIEASNAVQFFVDDDPTRQNNSFMGKPIFPADAIQPEESIVLIPILPLSLAKKLSDRLSQLGHEGVVL